MTGRIWLAAGVICFWMAAPGRAQDKTAPPGPAAAPAPPATRPAAAPTGVPPPAPTPTAPPAQPAAGTPAAGAASTASGAAVTVRVPSGGDYSAFLQEATDGSLKPVPGQAQLTLPAGAKTVTLVVLDRKSGYAARRVLNTSPAPGEQSFAAADFKLVQRVRVQVTGKDNKPIAAGSVALTDGDKAPARKILQASDQGTAEFEMVARGAGTVAVTPEGGATTTKEVTLDLGRGETTQTIPIALPEVTAVLETPVVTAPAAPAAAPATAPSAAPAGAPTPAPAAAPPAAPPQPYGPPPGGMDFGSTLISFLFLAALIYGGYVYGKRQGWTIEMILKRLGVQPDVVGQGGASLAGANVAAGVPSPGAPPPPPPIVADPNQCPFCGQMKDASGGCACVVVRGAAAPGVFGPAPGGGPHSASSGGPRLVGSSGVYFGQIFPILGGAAVIGREPTNPIPLDQDSTSSRRHAQIVADGGSYRLQDLGSANGTFLNGQRITDSPLNPGDEVLIGGTRFRFEV